MFPISRLLVFAWVSPFLLSTRLPPLQNTSDESKHLLTQDKYGYKIIDNPDVRISQSLEPMIVPTVTVVHVCACVRVYVHSYVCTCAWM